MEYSLSFKEGDHVVYFPTGAETNPTSGVIKKVIHEREQVGSQLVQASEEMPRYVIVNDNTHKESAYKLENIIEKVKEGGYGEEIEETGGGNVEELVGNVRDEGELEEGDEIYEPEPEEGGEDEEEGEEEEEEEFDEKEYIREAAEIGSSVRIN